MASLVVLVWVLAPLAFPRLRGSTVIFLVPPQLLAVLLDPLHRRLKAHCVGLHQEVLLLLLLLLPPPQVPRYA